MSENTNRPECSWTARHATGLFRAAALAFAAVMLAVCGLMGWAMITGHATRLRIEDARADLESNRGRQRLQLAEYNEVVRVIPEIEARIAALEPRVEEARLAYAALKAQRDEVKGSYRNIRDAAAAAQQEARDAVAAYSEAKAAYDALLRQLGLSGEEAGQP